MRSLHYSGRQITYLNLMIRILKKLENRLGCTDKCLTDALFGICPKVMNARLLLVIIYSVEYF